MASKQSLSSMRRWHKNLTAMKKGDFFFWLQQYHVQSKISSLLILKGVRNVTFLLCTCTCTHLHVQYLRNRKPVPCFYQVIETRVEVWENDKCCENTSVRGSVSKAFLSSPKLSLCTVAITRQKHREHVFYFFQKTPQRKRGKQLIYFDYKNVSKCVMLSKCVILFMPSLHQQLVLVLFSY